MEILDKVELFNGIKQSELNLLLKCLSGERKKFNKNETIYMMEEKIEKIGIVLLGGVQVLKEDYDGNRNIIGNLGPAELFGESFAFTNSKRSPVTVQTREKSEILFISPENIVSPCPKACNFHNQLIYNMLNILAIKNVGLNEKIEVLTKKTTREKILSFLYSKGLNKTGKEIKIDFNRQELADYLSVNRSALSAELSNMRKDGLIEFEKNLFKLK